MDQVERGAPINCTAGAVPIKNEKGKPRNANSDAVLSHCDHAFTIAAFSFVDSSSLVVFAIYRRVDNEEGESQ